MTVVQAPCVQVDCGSSLSRVEGVFLPRDIKSAEDKERLNLQLGKLVQILLYVLPEAQRQTAQGRYEGFRNAGAIEQAVVKVVGGFDSDTGAFQLFEDRGLADCVMPCVEIANHVVRLRRGGGVCVNVRGIIRRRAAHRGMEEELGVVGRGWRAPSADSAKLRGREDWGFLQGWSEFVGDPGVGAPNIRELTPPGPCVRASRKRSGTDVPLHWPACLHRKDREVQTLERSL